MNAVKFLIKEHNKVRKIFSQIYDKLDNIPQRTKMLENLSHDLLIHEKMEQTVWYPRISIYTALEKRINHLIKEEDSAEKTIKQFRGLNSLKKWEQLFLKLKSAVEKHAKEEETKLFPNVLKCFSESELKALGSEMKKFKIKNLKLVINKNLTGYKPVKVNKPVAKKSKIAKVNDKASSKKTKASASQRKLKPKSKATSRTSVSKKAKK